MHKSMDSIREQKIRSTLDREGYHPMAFGDLLACPVTWMSLNAPPIECRKFAGVIAAKNVNCEPYEEWFRDASGNLIGIKPLPHLFFFMESLRELATLREEIIRQALEACPRLGIAFKDAIAPVRGENGTYINYDDLVRAPAIEVFRIPEEDEPFFGGGAIKARILRCNKRDRDWQQIIADEIARINDGT